MAQFKNKTHLHPVRKIWHASSLLVLVGLYYALGRGKALTPLVLLVSGFWVWEILRRRSVFCNHLLMKVFSPILRDYEATKVIGSSWAVLGCGVSLGFFPEPVAYMACLFLAVGDPCASTVGFIYGKKKWTTNKSLAGSVGAFVACALIAAWVLRGYGFFEKTQLLAAATISGAIGAVSEAFTLGKWDDNLVFALVELFAFKFNVLLYGARAALALGCRVALKWSG